MFCAHKWAWLSFRTIETAARTEVSGICRKCGMPKVKTIKGEWTPPRVSSSTSVTPTEENADA